MKTIHVVAILAVGVVLTLLFTGNIPLQAGVNGEDGGQNAGNLLGILTRQSISTSLHSTIDPVAPTFLHDAHVACVNAGGTWHDQGDKVGCFSMPPGAWDATNCLLPQIAAIQQACGGIDGAFWTCNSVDAGCHY